MDEQERAYRRRLRLLLASGRLSARQRESFEEMAARRGPPSRSQMQYVLDVYERLELDADEGAQNLWSSGKVLPGADVPIPDVLKHRPLRPPSKKPPAY